MNFEEFIERIFHLTDVSIPNRCDWKDLEVVVTTGDPSLGGRNKSVVKSIHRGIDWEHNQIRIETEDTLRKE